MLSTGGHGIDGPFSRQRDLDCGLEGSTSAGWIRRKVKQKVVALGLW